MGKTRRSRKRTRDSDSSRSDSESPVRSHSRSSRSESRYSHRHKRSRHGKVTNYARRSSSRWRRRRSDRGSEQYNDGSVARIPVPDSPVGQTLDKDYASPIAGTSGLPHQLTSKDDPCDSNNLLTVFKEIIQSMKTDGNNERYPVMNVIPEFDPSKRNQTVDTWISKVNECATIYNWTERQITHYALPKLVGVAQRWYQGLPSLMFSWAEWQNKLRLAFPNDENYGQLLSEMLDCKARYGDSLEEYFYNKMVLLSRCNISGKNAIDCILFGIEDRSVRTSAEAAQFTELDRLLVYLRNVKANKRPEKSNTTLQPSNSENKRYKPFKISQNGSDTRSFPKCYNCKEEGHPFYKCKQPIKRCDICRKIGHITQDCISKNETLNTSKTVLRVSQEQDTDFKYFKIAKVNGQTLDCFIDFGSQCTMLLEIWYKRGQ